MSPADEFDGLSHSHTNETRRDRGEANHIQVMFSPYLVLGAEPLE